MLATYEVKKKTTFFKHKCFCGPSRALRSTGSYTQWACDETRPVLT